MEDMERITEWKKKVKYNINVVLVYMILVCNF